MLCLQIALQIPNDHLNFEVNLYTFQSYSEKLTVRNLDISFQQEAYGKFELSNYEINANVFRCIGIYLKQLFFV